LEVQQPIHRDVHRVMGSPGDDCLGEGVAQARSASLASHVLLGGAHPGKRIGDGAVSGTTAKITLKRVRQIGTLIVIERSCSHDHADRKSTRLNSSHQIISYAVFCLKKKTKKDIS